MAKSTSNPIIIVKPDKFADLVIAKLIKLCHKSFSLYLELVDEWRDVLPHTGSRDVMLGSDKFRPWLIETASDEQGLLDLYRMLAKADELIQHSKVLKNTSTIQVSALYALQGGGTGFFDQSGTLRFLDPPGPHLSKYQQFDQVPKEWGCQVIGMVDVEYALTLKSVRRIDVKTE